jgi:YidC/Oxa1 family membrane protein insertase
MMAVFNGLIDFVGRILSFLYDLPVVGGSYGFAIILLTLVVMVLLMPLTLKATRSTIKMQQIQPELRRVQKKYKGKDDRQAMNAEVMKLYSENGISPVGGCLPMLAQLPVFLVLFRILRGLTRRIEDRPFFDLANRLREAGGNTPLEGRFFAPEHVSTESQLYRDLTTSTEMRFGPFDLAERALDVLQSDFVASLPYVALIIFVVGSSYYQQRQVSARRTTDPAAEQTPMMQQQQLLLKVLPLMSGVWSFLFPAGLVLYWATSNLFRIGQQSYITMQIYGKEAPEIEATAQRLREQSPDEDDDADESATDQDEAELESTKPKSKNKKQQPELGTSNGDGTKKADGKPSAEDRDAEWQRRRQQKAKTSSAKRSAVSSNSKSSGETADESQSSRLTPKGTKASMSKKKRKR